MYTLFLNQVEKFEINGYFRSEYLLKFKCLSIKHQVTCGAFIGYGFYSFVKTVE